MKLLFPVMLALLGLAGCAREPELSLGGNAATQVDAELDDDGAIETDPTDPSTEDGAMTGSSN